MVPEIATLLDDVDVIDDADDRRIHGRRLLAERFARRAPFEHDQHLLMHAGADAVHREQRVAARRVVGVQRLNQQQLGALELSMLLRRDDGADHTRNLHEPWLILLDAHRSTVQ